MEAELKAKVLNQGHYDAILYDLIVTEKKSPMYLLLTGSRDHLEDKVNEKLKEGWELKGKTIPISWKSSGPEYDRKKECIEFQQVMVKE